jgi:hypothetical protein
VRRTTTGERSLRPRRRVSTGDERIREVERMLLTQEGAKRGLTYDDIAPGLLGTWTQVTSERERRDWTGRWRIIVDRKTRPVAVTDVVRRPRTGEIVEIVVRVEDFKEGEFGIGADGKGRDGTLRFTLRRRGSFVLASYRNSGRGNWLRVGSHPIPEEILTLTDGVS